LFRLTSEEELLIGNQTAILAQFLDAAAGQITSWVKSLPGNLTVASRERLCSEKNTPAIKNRFVAFNDYAIFEVA